MSQLELFYRFGVALVIGILIGLEREHSADHPDREMIAGVRTFALISLAGCTGALLADILGSPWPFVALLLFLGILLTVAYLNIARSGQIGATTEVAAIITFLAGALCYWGYLALAAAIAVTTTLLLSLKLEMHRFAHVISREDVYATLKFAVITAIVLPLLPDRSFGPPPFDVLNPYRVWLMVILISGISFTGYVLMKVVNVRHGIGLTGILGGLASSTAVTLSFSQRSKGQSVLARPFAMAITIAWTIMFLRVIIEVGAINRALLEVVWPALTITALAALAYAVFIFFRDRSRSQEEISFANPFELRPAVLFGLLYAAILVISRAAEVYLGNSGVYLSSIVAGAADVDAIALSMAELSNTPSGLDLRTAARAVMLAALANTLLKAGIVFSVGSSGLRKAIVPTVLILLLAGTSTIFLL